jgi:hypothetical protein
LRFVSVVTACCVNTLSGFASCPLVLCSYFGLASFLLLCYCGVTSTLSSCCASHRTHAAFSVCATARRTVRRGSVRLRRCPATASATPRVDVRRDVARAAFFAVDTAPQRRQHPAALRAHRLLHTACPMPRCRSGGSGVSLLARFNCQTVAARVLVSRHHLGHQARWVFWKAAGELASCVHR